MANKVTTVFENDVKGAVQSNEELAKSLDGTESKAKLVAQALHDQADGIEADFKNSVAAADALAAALGPEMAAKVGQNGIDKFVADLKGVGLTADDIRGDVDVLAGALQHLDDVSKTVTGPKQGLDEVAGAAEHAKGKIGDLRGESDNSRSVLANMVGNSAQDVAGLGGVAGTAGMALGQMGEYATEGNIKLSGLAKVAGPMAAVTVATMAISSVLGDIAATKAFNKKQVEDWTQAIKEGKASVEELAAAAEEAGKIEFRMGGTKDLVPILGELGIKAKDFFAAIEGGQPARDAMVQYAKDQGADFKQMASLLTALDEGHQNYTKSLEAVATQQGVFGESTASLKDKQDQLVEAAKKVADVVGKEIVRANEDAAAAEEQHRLTVEEWAKGVQRNVDEIMASFDELRGNISDDQAWLNLQTSFDEVKAKAVDAWKATADGAEDAEQKTRDANSALNAHKLELIDYAQNVLGVPKSVVTAMITQLDQGQYDAVERKLAILARNRNIGFDLDFSVHSPSYGGARAGGGSTREGKYYEVTEGSRPEMYEEGGRRYLLPGGNGQVTPMTPRAPGEGAPVGEGNGVIQIFVTINAAGHVMTERDITRHFYDAIIDGQARGELPVGIL